MIDPSDLIAWLEENGVSFFAGVPDSLLKEFSAHVMAHVPSDRHVITANEGNAVAVAMGYHLRTGRTPLVYLQNSGIGNAVNPLLSLADPEVYAIPMVLLVGWRGQPGAKDEPQHVKQGRVMTAMLNGIDIPFALLPTEPSDARATVEGALRHASQNRTPFLLLAKRGTFDSAESARTHIDDCRMTREEAVASVATAIGTSVPIVATTGMLSRELFEHREHSGLDRSFDFLAVGGMGHASSIALGIALAAPQDEVWCLDGDGALLMHMGALAVVGDRGPRGFHHVVFNNGVHDSVGGQPTSIDAVDLPAVALSVSYRWARRTAVVEEIPELIDEMRRNGGPALLEIRVKPGSRENIGRPTRTTNDSRAAFMAALGVE